jgi:hypothetical protein
VGLLVYLVRENFMFNVSIEQIEEYHEKSNWIANTVRELNQEGLINELEDGDEIDRILPGRTVFWLIKKTVDMNYNSVLKYIKRRE